MLPKTAFTQSRQFIAGHARPLEAARMRVHFDGAPVTEAAAELAKYQNPDGGFGRALEPDLRSPHSSALATMHALALMRELGPQGFAHLAGPAIAYLLASYDGASQTWRIIPREAGDSPHAPWWEQDRLAETFNHFQLNPTARLLGYWYDYQELVPPALLASLSEQVLGRVRESSRLEMADFAACASLLDTAGLAADYRQALLGELLRLLPTAVTTDPAGWADYSLRPLEVVPRPQARLYPALQESIQANLEYTVATQNPDGSWTPTWTWMGAYPQVWALARGEWMGWLTA